MIVKVNVKQIGKRKKVVDNIPFQYETVPETVEELITETVKICLDAYKKRVEAADTMICPQLCCETSATSETSEDSANISMLHSKESIEEMAEIGKIAFGISYGEKVPDEKEAEDTAITAFEDGLYRIFSNGEELSDLQQSIVLNEDTELTFIRLTMLAGRIW